MENPYDKWYSFDFKKDFCRSAGDEDEGDYYKNILLRGKIYRRFQEPSITIGVISQFISPSVWETKAGFRREKITSLRFIDQTDASISQDRYEEYQHNLDLWTETTKVFVVVLPRYIERLNKNYLNKRVPSETIRRDIDRRIENLDRLKQELRQKNFPKILLVACEDDPFGFFESFTVSPHLKVSVYRNEGKEGKEVHLSEFQYSSQGDFKFTYKETWEKIKLYCDQYETFPDNLNSPEYIEYHQDQCLIFNCESVDKIKSRLSEAKDALVSGKYGQEETKNTDKLLIN